MIKEIRKRWEAGERVKLECVDRNGLLNINKNKAFQGVNKELLRNEELIVTGICIEHGFVSINGDDYRLLEKELKYFSIKRPDPTFDDLVDTAIKAARDGVAIITHLEIDSIMIESINYNSLSPIEIYRGDELEIKEAIDWVNSLYTETFVIESDSDIERLQDGAEITLANNERGIFSVIGELKFITNTKTNNVIMGLNIFFLKGATVTQKRDK